MRKSNGNSPKPRAEHVSEWQRRRDLFHTMAESADSKRRLDRHPDGDKSAGGKASDNERGK